MRSLRQRLRQLDARDGERGAVIPLVIIVLTTLIIFASFAIDLGYQRVARRDMQALADVVALDLSRAVNGRTAAQITADPTWTTLRTQSVARNASTAGAAPTVTATLGVVNTTTNAFTPVSGASIPTAVRVTAHTSVGFFFKRGSGGATRTAVATNRATVDYQLGSFLVGLSPFQNSLLSQILSRAFCPDSGASAATCTAALDVLSYSGLVSTKIGLGALATQLGFGSPTQLLSSNVGIRSLLQASAAVLPSGTSPTAAAALNGAAAQLTNTSTVRLGDFIDLQQGNGDNAAQSTIDVLGLLVGSAFLIDNDNLVSVPGAAVNIPGIASLQVRLRAIETVQYVKGALPGYVLSTSQIQLDVTANVSGINVGGILGALSGTITVGVTVGGADAPLQAAQCTVASGSTSGTARIGVTPKPLALNLSENLTVASLLGINVARVQVTNLVTSVTGATQANDFAYTSAFLPPVGTGSTVRMGSTQIGLASLLGPTSANVTLLGIPIAPLGTVVSLLATTLNPLLASLDTLVIDPLAKALGLNLGGGDVGANDMHCNAPTLAG